MVLEHSQLLAPSAAPFAPPAHTPMPNPEIVTVVQQERFRYLDQAYARNAMRELILLVLQKVALIVQPESSLLWVLQAVQHALQEHFRKKAPRLARIAILVLFLILALKIARHAPPDAFQKAGPLIAAIAPLERFLLKAIPAVPYVPLVLIRAGGQLIAQDAVQVLFRHSIHLQLAQVASQDHFHWQILPLAHHVLPALIQMVGRAHVQLVPREHFLPPVRLVVNRVLREHMPKLARKHVNLAHWDPSLWVELVVAPCVQQENIHRSLMKMIAIPVWKEHFH